MLPVGRAQLGRRAPWLADEPNVTDLLRVTAYIRAILSGDDAVAPDVEMAERAVMLLAGILQGSGSGNVADALDDLDDRLRAGLVDEVNTSPPNVRGWSRR